MRPQYVPGFLGIHILQTFEDGVGHLGTAVGNRSPFHSRVRSRRCSVENMPSLRERHLRWRKKSELLRDVIRRDVFIFLLLTCSSAARIGSRLKPRKPITSWNPRQTTLTGASWGSRSPPGQPPAQTPLPKLCYSPSFRCALLDAASSGAGRAEKRAVGMVSARAEARPSGSTSITTKRAGNEITYRVSVVQHEKTSGVHQHH
jgi:hypothetical protein